MIILRIFLNWVLFESQKSKIGVKYEKLFDGFDYDEWTR